MICSIHQPNYIPYLGLFDKIQKSDIFVFYDIAQYSKGDYHNRNKIKGANGEILLTIPVKINSGDKIKEVCFDNSILKKHLKTIEQSYKKSRNFTVIMPFLEDIFGYNGSNLSEFNIIFIKKVCVLLGINTKFFTLSDYVSELKGKNTDALIEIISFFGSNHYISGSGGKNYINEDTFNNNHIYLEYQSFQHPIYNQLWGDFLPYLSVIDFLFNTEEYTLKSV